MLSLRNSKLIVLYITTYGRGYCNINGRPVGLEPLKKSMARSAADMVEKYISIVQDCLVGDSHLHGVVGDDIIVISSSPDHQ